MDGLRTTVEKGSILKVVFQKGLIRIAPSGDLSSTFRLTLETSYVGGDRFSKASAFQSLRLLSDLDLAEFPLNLSLDILDGRLCAPTDGGDAAGNIPDGDLIPAGAPWL